MNRAVIFDMDGVIVDSEIHWKSLEGYFLQTLIPTWGVVDQGKITGMSIHDLYRLLSSGYGLQQTKEEFLAFYQDIAAEIYGQKVSLIPGFTRLLSELLENNVPIAVASSSPMAWINIVLDRFNLRGSFKAVVSADELENGQGKPSPAIYLLTAQRLGIDPARCIVIEDSQNGALSARSAGMFCIGFRNGFNEEQDLSAANIIAHGYGELDWQAMQRLI